MSSGGEKPLATPRSRPDDVFSGMRAVLRPRGTAPVVNMSAYSQSTFYDADHVREAIDTAQRRIQEVSTLRGIAEPLNPLEKLAITFLLKSSGQYELRNEEVAPVRSDESTEGMEP